MSEKKIGETPQKKDETPPSLPLNPNYKTIIRLKPGEAPSKCIEISSHNIILKEKPLPPANANSMPIAPPKEKEEIQHKFSFSNLLDHNTSQDSVFKLVSEHCVSKLIEGQPGCIISYGQTNSGKTFTIFGEDEHFSTKGSNEMDMRKDKKGIVPRTMEYILRKAKDFEDVREFVIQASFFELYLDQIRDLGKGLLDKHNASH